MYQHIYKSIFFLCMFAFAKAYHCNAQEKIEREYRIDRTLVPQKVLNLVEVFTNANSVKWLREESEEGSSIEAKFKKDQKRYSMEFDSSGDFEDLEIVIDFNSIPEEAKETITSYLKATFDYYKIEKTQAQYLANRAEPLHWNLFRGVNESTSANYEIVLKTRNKGEGTIRYEFLFDSAGQLLKRVKVAVRSDNILRF